MFGVVGIDMIAGPSEVVVLADRTADPRFVAADLLAQAEHDAAAQSILVTDDRALALARRPRSNASSRRCRAQAIAGASWRDYGAIILCDDARGRAAARSSASRPSISRSWRAIPRRFAERIVNAGAIFLGAHTPEAIGDYVGGSNHVLPTARSARFSSGLGVLDFMKRTSLLKCDARSLAALGPAAIALGRAESLDAHARSVAIRLAEETGP